LIILLIPSIIWNNGILSLVFAGVGLGLFIYNVYLLIRREWLAFTPLPFVILYTLFVLWGACMEWCWIPNDSTLGK
jgi:hypothetical protein